MGKEENKGNRVGFNYFYADLSVIVNIEIQGLAKPATSTRNQ